MRITFLVVTTRRTRFTGLRAAWRLRTTFLPVQGEHLAVCARAAGTSATCIAPLPIIAPPQVHAQSLARAIRTDIDFLSFPLQVRSANDPAPSFTFRYAAERPKLCERRNRVNRVCLSDSGKPGAKSIKIAIYVPK
ncbi:MAG: hypothetical protein RIA72_03810 [Sphingopyxis sp.]|uniref:hypothetical protein n=1 Tax=Sphingopyxis sp. TaxID=1908224 RepID=UPI0032EBD667